MFRMISSLGRVDSSHLRTGNFHDEDWLRINTAVQLMSDAPLYIDDTPAMTPIEVRARARRLKREHGLGLIDTPSTFNGASNYFMNKQSVTNKNPY